MFASLETHALCRRTIVLFILPRHQDFDHPNYRYYHAKSRHYHRYNDHHNSNQYCDLVTFNDFGGAVGPKINLAMFAG
jgi:hypothetical protein